MQQASRYRIMKIDLPVTTVWAVIELRRKRVLAIHDSFDRAARQVGGLR